MHGAPYGRKGDCETSHRKERSVKRFLELFGPFVQFTYAIWDRIVIRGYYERLQRPENIVYFFRDVCGIPAITPSVLASRTNDYRTWVKGYAAKRGIPILAAPKGVRKENFVLPYYRRFRQRRQPEGVVVILTSLEQGPTFISYEPRYRPPSGDHYRIIKRAAEKRFLHYYFYVMDRVMGPMSIRVASYLPFSVGCHMNGHSFLAQQLGALDITFNKHDNAVVSCADPEALVKLCGRLNETTIRQRANDWAFRLAPSFSRRERRFCGGLQYQWSVAQIEFSQNVIFRRRTPLRELFRRATEIGVALGGATETRHIFGRRINRRYQGKLEKVLDRRDEGHPVLRAYYQTSYVKQYEKGDRFLRTETCLNDTYHLGVGRLLKNLPQIEDQLRTTTDRYLGQQAELLDSTVDTGALENLGKPVVVGKRRVPGIRLHDDRVIRLLDVLLYTGGLLGDWTTRDLHERLLARHRLTEKNYRVSQLRYDLSKLRAHGLVERIGSSRRYRLTTTGVRLGTLLVKTRNRLLGPIFADHIVRRPHRSENPSDVEAALRKVDKAIDGLCVTLGLRLAG